MAWLQLRVHTAKPEFAEEILLAHGASAVSMVDAADNPVLEPAPGQTPLWVTTVTVGMFADGQDVAPIVESLHEVLPEGAALRMHTELIEDQEWIRVWLKDCPPLKFGERLWIVPHERAAEVTDPAAIVVKLDPGLAFGTGTHPSTALCLEWNFTDSPLPLAGEGNPKDREKAPKVLDYGCGSGILAIAALKLGAQRAVCSDIDPQALTAAKQNAQANDVADRLTAVAANDFVPFPADVVLANILANPLVALAPRLASSIRAGGRIVLAGLLDEQVDEVRAAYEPWFTFESARPPQSPRSVEGWSLLVGQCRTPALINDLTVREGLRTGGQPQASHFPQLAASGIRAVINLAVPGASPNFLLDEDARVQRAGMAYTHIPVKWDEPTTDDLLKFFARMEELRGQSVLVHCALNMRVSAFVFLYRVLVENIPVDVALRDLHRIWEPNDVWRCFIERTLTQHQVKFSAS